MKKIISTIAAFTMAFALCSCGRSADSEPAAAQPSEVTTAATAETAADTAAVTTVPQSEPTTTTTAESEATTPENTTTAETTTTSDSKTTTTAEKKTTTAKKTAAPKNTTAAKQTAAPKKTTTTPKKTTAKPATTTKQKWTRALSEDEYNKLSWEEQDDYMQWYFENCQYEYHTVELSDSEFQKIKEKEIQKVLDELNNERKKAGLNPVSIEPQLQKGAEIRAKECEILFDHVRPDGSRCFSIYEDMEGLDPVGEVCGGSIAGYMDDLPHREILLSPKAQYVGIGISGIYAYKYYNNIEKEPEDFEISYGTVIEFACDKDITIVYMG